MMAELTPPGESSDKSAPVVLSRLVRFAPLAPHAAAGPGNRLRKIARHILCRTLACATSAFSTLAFSRLGAGMLLFGMLLAGTGLRAQVPTQPAGQPQGQPRMVEGPDTITFSMNENNGMELAEFIKWTQEVTGRRFTFTLSELTAAGQGNTITFLGPMTLKKVRFKEDFYSFFQTMLYIKNFAIVPRGEGDLEILEIISITGPRQREITNGAKYVTPDELSQYRNQTGVPILTTMPLKHINATIATNALRPFYASTGGTAGGAQLTLGNVGNNTAMLLQGYGPQVYAAVKLLELVDVPVEQPNLTVQVQVLENQAPEELEPILTEVLESRSKIRQQVLQEQGGQQGAAPSVSGQPQLKIVVHGQQRALVLSGTQEQVHEALELIARLDVPSQPIDGSANVRHLNNVLAKDLETTLSQFMQEDVQAEQNAQAPTGGAGGSTPARRTRRTVIKAH
jgi:hypothetical protein